LLRQFVGAHGCSEVSYVAKDVSCLQKVFGVAGYMLIVIHYAKAATEGHVYIRSFLTHKQSDNPTNWDRKSGTI
jgi:hypothetical protein